jgi:Fe-S-cluster containining protein
VSDGPRPVLRGRTSAFSYHCGACSRCCYGRRIQVNPYELARLSRGLGITTTEVISQFTVDVGTALATRADTACTFLGPNGCTVHADRPLACRLYPLGRIVQADGSETFVENEPDPRTKGLYGADGTVDSYIQSQSVVPYIAAADRYYAILRRLMSVGDAPGTLSGENVARATATSDDTSAEIDAMLFIDADLAVQSDAAHGGGPVPADVEALVDRHLALIERWAEELIKDR